MNKIQLYNVAPSMPEELKFLEKLAMNMWWCWNSDALELFRRIDPALWVKSEHNPLLFFSMVPQKRFEALVNDDGFMSHLDEIQSRFEAELKPKKSTCAKGSTDCVAYFSLEYGIHESLRIYSGGLGCLAGDHLKSASDIGVPLVAVGLLYRCGYFQQYLSNDGWQQEACVENEIHHLPLQPALDQQGNQLIVKVPLPDGILHAAVWRIDVGRIPLFLLDTNVVENSETHRRIGTHLYDSDRLVRLRQEILLGIGGYRSLMQLGFDPSVFHMNEGHAAFVCLERIAHMMKAGNMTMDVAREVTRRTNVFTTHTPVPAGNESFSVDLVKPHLAVIQQELGIPAADVIKWGQMPGAQHSHEITMTILALQMSVLSNGVSRLHGEVSRKMWSNLWPGRPEDEIPIGHITNGVHVASWISHDNSVLLDRYLGPEWRDNPTDPDMLARIENIPDEELWRAKELGRSRLVRATRELGERQLRARNATSSEVDQVRSVFHHDVLTIGFARRFAAYKRATLLLRDRDRLKALLTNNERPVQIVFAGKAHPADDVGKNFIREIIEFAREENIRTRLIFLENYDIQIARYMVQGVDVWLNTPRRPQEASGTSGMKATINGALHLSILDGWWDEAYSPECGWAIGKGEVYDNTDYQDAVESQALYNVLEDKVVPLFYDSNSGGVPMKWLKMMKASIAMGLGRFSSHRMVSEYKSELYIKAKETYDSLIADNSALAGNLVTQYKRLHELWPAVKVHSPVMEKDLTSLHVGDDFDVSVVVELGKLKPEEVDVEVYYGPVRTTNSIQKSYTKRMDLAESMESGKHVFKQKVTCEKAGRFGLMARVTPQGKDWQGVVPGFITWPDGDS